MRHKKIKGVHAMSWARKWNSAMTTVSGKMKIR